MKTISKVTVIVVAMSLLTISGTVWAGPVAPSCPVLGHKCVVKGGEMYCNWTEEVMVNKLVPGRAGLWGWQRMPTFELRTEKCRWM